jgi:hypothetical protein
MQLSVSRLALLVLGAWLLTSTAWAQSTASMTGTYFHERGGPLKMTVFNPSIAANADVVDALSLQASWEADVVTGASVRVVDAPGDVDAITSATKLEDFRQVVRGGATLRGETTRLAASYAYGFESDYRSHALALSGASELFDRNTTLEISYGRGWDAVCDLSQPNAQEAVERQPLPTSEGCFGANGARRTRPIALHTIGGAWTQNWTPIFNTQWSVSTQLISGFQSNPYRAVWLGRAAAQEHHPMERARYGSSLEGRIWLRPIGGALQFGARLYRDTWDVAAVSGELAYERSIGALFRARVRGRYYHQGAAAFYSDDYALRPRGQYFSGDRELSAMRSYLVGARFEFTPELEGGWIRAFRVVLKADLLQHAFDDFHYGRVEVPNRRSIFATLGLDATF